MHQVLEKAAATIRGGSAHADIVSAQVHWSRQSTEDRHRSLELIGMGKEDALLQIIGMASRNTGDWLDVVFEAP